MKIPMVSFTKLYAFLIVGLVLKVTAQSLNIIDKNLGLDFTHFEVDVNSEHGKKVIEALESDPNQISLDAHFS